MPRTREFDPDEVLDKAMHIFWQYGYEGTSMNELEEGLGINKCSIYNTFGNKRQLYLAALDRYGRVMGGSLVAKLTHQVNGLATIREFFDFMEQIISSQDDRVGCFMVNAGVEMSCQDPEVCQRVQSAHRHIEDAFYDNLAIAQQKGELPANTNLREYARFLVTLLQGLITVAKSEQDTRTVKSTLQHIRYLLSGS